MHKVSVIIPIYNVEKYLPKCLDSVINQTYKNLEIICVNDCSPDNCDKILQEYAARDKRIKIVNVKRNSGRSAVRNTGLKTATGEYIYFVDADDWIDSNYIEQMLYAAIKNNVSVVFNNNIVEHKVNMQPEQFTSNELRDLICNKFLDAQSCIFYLLTAMCSYIWEKSFLDKINANFPEGYNFEDIYFQATTFPFLDKIYAIHGDAYHYVRQPQSLTVNTEQIDLYKIRLTIMKKIYEFYKNNNLLEQINVCLIPPNIFPSENENKYLQIEELKKYFAVISNTVNQQAHIYPYSSLRLYNDVLYDRDKAIKTDYGKLLLLDKLRAKTPQGAKRIGGIVVK